MIYLKNRENFSWLNDKNTLFLERGYLLEGTSPIQRVKDIAHNAEGILLKPGFADKFFNYMAKGYYSLSSPIWSNFGLTRGLPISCFGSYIGDSIPQITETNSEVGVMSQMGGGTSGYFGHIRARGSAIKNNGKSDGSFNFARMFDTTIDVISQGTSRKGHFAGYIDIEHGDVEEWLGIHTEGNPIQLMHYGVCVGNDWLKEMEEGDEEKRTLWAKILQRKCETGLPYLFFKDNANLNKPDVYLDKQMEIYASNLCTEIMLPSNEEESFVCCLSSMNLLYYDEWKDTDAVETMVYFLDAVLSEFITKIYDMFHSSDIGKQKAYQNMKKALNFAERHRAIGLGALGWHSYLQSKMIPFDSMEAMYENTKIFSLIQEKCYSASEEMAKIYGEPEVLKGYGRRHTTLMSIAPTKSSSFILGNISPSVEPIESNYYIKDLAKIKTIYKNPALEQLLKSKGYDNEEIWSSIKDNNGSVNHLDFLSEEEKNVFKVFREVSQLNVIQQAAARQKYIDQGQSINITVHPDLPVPDLNKIYLEAAKIGLKSLYYQNNLSAAQEFSRNMTTCINCEG